eukprot:792829_1
MSCSTYTDCKSCIKARKGFDACEWVMDSEPHFCTNWFDCANCYDDTASFERQCPMSALSIVGIVIGVIAALIICIICAVYLYRQQQRTMNSTHSNNNDVPIVPIGQSHMISDHINPSAPKVIYVQNVPQPPPAYDDIQSNAPLYSSEGQIT